ncbi:hypothetical protein WA158_004108 [Blastocystis sp. Blastoise]
MISLRQQILFIFFITTASSIYCGHFSDACQVEVIQGYDVFLYSGLSGVDSIVTRSFEPTSTSCKEPHRKAIIRKYSIDPIPNEEYSYKTILNDVQFIYWDVTAVLLFNCNITFQTNTAYSVNEFSCNDANTQYWNQLRAEIGSNTTMSFAFSDSGNLLYKDETYIYMDAQGCPLSLSHSGQIILLLSLLFIGVIFILFMVYFIYKHQHKSMSPSSPSQSLLLDTNEEFELSNLTGHSRSSTPNKLFSSSTRNPSPLLFLRHAFGNNPTNYVLEFNDPSTNHVPSHLNIMTDDRSKNTNELSSHSFSSPPISL